MSLSYNENLTEIIIHQRQNELTRINNYGGMKTNWARKITK